MVQERVSYWRRLGELHSAKLIISQVNKSLSDLTLPKDQLEEQASMFLAVIWSRQLILQIGASKVSNILRRLKIAPIPSDLSRIISESAKSAYEDESSAFPSEYEHWRSFIIQHRLVSEATMGEWLIVINQLNALSVKSPIDLQGLTRGEMMLLADSSSDLQHIPHLWGASMFASESSAGITPKESKGGLITNASAVTALFRATDLRNTPSAKRAKSLKRELALPLAFDTAGPAAKIQMLADKQRDPNKVNELLNSVSQLNLLRQVKNSLPSVASGIANYCSFCDLQNIPYFPPTENTVRLWSATFNPGRTFSMYVNHLEKACQMLQLTGTWRTSSINALAKGLKNDHDQSHRFENFFTLDQLKTLVKQKTLDDKLVQLCYLSFIFLLRTKNEAVPLIRALAEDDMLDKQVPVSGSHLIAVRRIQGIYKLIIRLKTRKNCRSGTVMVRTCSCSSESAIGHLLCPIHAFWKAIQPTIARQEPFVSSAT